MHKVSRDRLSYIMEQRSLPRASRGGLLILSRVGKLGVILGLALFVAVPLPVTGVYTATILAWLLGIDWKKAFPPIGLGTVVAGIIVLLITLGVITGLSC